MDSLAEFAVDEAILCNIEVSRVVTELVDAAAHAEWDHRLMQREDSHLVSRVLEVIRNDVNAALPRADSGVNIPSGGIFSGYMAPLVTSFASEKQGLWHASEVEQVRSIPIDSWATGIVPMKKRPLPPADAGTRASGLATTTTTLARRGPEPRHKKKELFNNEFTRAPSASRSVAKARMSGIGQEHSNMTQPRQLTVTAREWSPASAGAGTSMTGQVPAIALSTVARKAPLPALPQ